MIVNRGTRAADSARAAPRIIIRTCPPCSRWTICAATPSPAPSSRRPRCRKCHHEARLRAGRSDPGAGPLPQDLTLRHRVADYRAGDLERRYPKLAIEEDFFVNYGSCRAAAPPDAPRQRTSLGPKAALEAGACGARVRARARRGAPADVDARFAARQDHQLVRRLLQRQARSCSDGMHYRGLLRVARREGGIRPLRGARGRRRRRADPEARLTR